MIKRPLNARFTAAVLEDRKVTTIRENAWPVGVPIMLYNWSGAAYRSKQIDVAPVIVERTSRVWIHHEIDGSVWYSATRLWISEGFDSLEDMNEWFRKVVKKGSSAALPMMHFRRIK